MFAPLLALFMYEVTSSIYWTFGSYAVGAIISYAYDRISQQRAAKKFMEWSKKITMDMIHSYDLLIQLHTLPGLSDSSQVFYESFDKLNEKLDTIHSDAVTYFKLAKNKNLASAIDLVLVVTYLARNKLENRRLPSVVWDGNDQNYVNAYVKGLRLLSREAIVERINYDLDSIHNRLLQAVNMRRNPEDAKTGPSFIQMRDSAQDDLNFLVPKYIPGNDPNLENIHSLRQELL